MNDRACANVIGHYRDYEAIPNQCFRKASFSVVDSTYAGYPFRIFLILQALFTKAPDCFERSLSINQIFWYGYAMSFYLRRISMECRKAS